MDVRGSRETERRRKIWINRDFEGIDNSESGVYKNGTALPKVVYQYRVYACSLQIRERDEDQILK